MSSQWLFLVPLKGGRWHITPQLAVYTTYILPSGGLYATYHLLGEPETTIDLGLHGLCCTVCTSTMEYPRKKWRNHENN